jgi:AraC-like DNA-binding protein
MSKAKNNYKRQMISTREVPDRDRGDYWSELIHELHCNMSLTWDEKELPEAIVHRQSAAGFQVLSYSAFPAFYKRDAGHISTDGFGDYEFLAPVTSFYYGEQMGRTIICGPGQFCLVDYSEPVEMGQKSTQQGFLFKVPRAMLEDRIADPSAACGVVLNGTGGIAKITLDFLKSIASETNFTHEEYIAVCNQLLDLFALSLKNGVDFHMSETTARTATLRRIKSYIRENLSMPGLGTRMISGAFGMSPRYIQILFKSAGLVICDYIRDERLKMAHRLLISPLHRQKSITEIAFQCGFSSSSYFSSAFKNSFGVSPRNLRQNASPILNGNF